MTIYEIARKAGVSVATVSRVINNSKNVSPKTRNRILKLIQEEDYVPSSLAQGLSGVATKDIGILLNDVRDQYFAEVVHSMEQEFSSRGYSSILCNTGGALDDQRNYLSLLMKKKVGAVILVGSVFRNPELETAVREVSSKIPVIIINESYSGENVYSLLCDEELGVKEAVRYLFGLGHTRFAFVKQADTYSARRKQNGFRLGLDEAGLDKEDHPVFQIAPGIEAARKIARKIMDLDNPCTAVISDEDLTAVGIVQGLQKLGQRIPQDYSIIGFNNSLYTECVSPSLTSIDSQMAATGLNAARLCLDVLEGRSVPARNMVLPELVVKGSTGKVKRS